MPMPSKYCYSDSQFLPCTLHIPLIPFTHFFIVVLRWPGSFVQPQSIVFWWHYLILKYYSIYYCCCCFIHTIFSYRYIEGITRLSNCIISLLYIYNCCYVVRQERARCVLWNQTNKTAKEKNHILILHTVQYHRIVPYNTYSLYLVKTYVKKQRKNKVILKSWQAVFEKEQEKKEGPKNWCVKQRLFIIIIKKEEEPKIVFENIT